MLRYGLSSDDVGGGEYISDSGGVSGAGGAAVWVPWAELRVDCAAVAGGGGVFVSETDGDCASGERMQRDGVGGWAVGGYDDGADTDGWGGDGYATGRSRS